LRGGGDQPKSCAMRILDVDPVRAAEAGRLTPHLLEGEGVLAAFASPTGSVIFAERRILLVQREHLLEERIETSSWPYRSVKRFAIQEGTAQGARTVMKIWLGDEEQPLQLRAASGEALDMLQRILAEQLD
jgi:hypothetical protein